MSRDDKMTRRDGRRRGIHEQIGGQVDALDRAERDLRTRWERAADLAPARAATRARAAGFTDAEDPYLTPEARAHLLRKACDAHSIQQLAELNEMRSQIACAQILIDELEHLTKET